jgi:hypothetical protein
VAERVGFEPTKSFDSALFKSAAFNRSATSPPERITGEGNVASRVMSPEKRREGVEASLFEASGR